MRGGGARLEANPQHIQDLCHVARGTPSATGCFWQPRAEAQVARASEAGECRGGESGQECSRLFMSQGLRGNTATRSSQVRDVPFGLDLTWEPRIYWLMRFPGSQKRVRRAVHHLVVHLEVSGAGTPLPQGKSQVQAKVKGWRNILHFQ